MQKISIRNLQQSLSRLGITQEMAATDVISLAKNYFCNNYGKALSKEIEVCWLKQASLGLKVSNSALRAKIKTEESLLIKHLNQQQTATTVQRLRFLL